MLRKSWLACCFVVLAFPFFNLMAQEIGEKKIASPKVNLTVSANQTTEEGKSVLVVSCIVKNAAGEKLFLFNAREPYIFPREDKIVEIGQYDPPIPKGSSGPYIFHSEIPVTIIKPQQSIEKIFRFAYPIEAFYPEPRPLKLLNDGRIDSEDKAEIVMPERIHLCLGIASPSQTKPEKKGKKSKGFYLASAFEIGRREIVCSDVIQLK